MLRSVRIASALHGLVAVMLLVSCNRKPASEASPQDAQAGTGGPAVSPPVDVPGAPNTPAEAPADPAQGLLAWLDPGAVAVAYTQLPTSVDMDGLMTVFATPPRVAQLLKDATDLDVALQAVLPADAPPPADWLGPETLAMLPALATNPYLLRPLTRPAREVQDILQRADMIESTAEGMTVMSPQKTFGYRALFLGEDVVAFVPIREIAMGISPLTAGRDLPPGEMEQELRTALAQGPATVLEVYGVGPLLHFDLSTEVLQFALHGRTWERSGLDVQTQLVADGDPATAASALEHRDVALESDGIAALCKRVAYSLEGSIVAGRLQLTGNDMAMLGVRP